MVTVQWSGVRLVVGMGAVGTVLALAQLTMFAMFSAFANLSPNFGP